MHVHRYITGVNDLNERNVDAIPRNTYMRIGLIKLKA